MENQTVNQKIETALGKKLNVKNWKDKRIYIHGYGFQTRKCKQNIYLDLDTFEIICLTDCESQSSQWCKSQSEIVVEALQAYRRLARLIAFVNRPQETITESIARVEAEITSEALDTQVVYGFTSEWRSERVKINSYGKLATRNRQFIYFFETTKNSASNKFTELSKVEYDAITGYIIGKEKMLEPFMEPDAYVAGTLERVEAVKAYAKQNAEIEELRKIEDEKIASEKKEKQLEFAAKLENVSGSEALILWKEAGCPHPAPAIVAEFKTISGLAWKEFIKTIN